MDVIFLAYANNPNTPLPSLREEADGVYRLLSPRALQQHYLLHRDAYADITKIAEYLTLYREYITVFHYGGHADHTSLLLEQETAHAGGIAHLLGQCPRLQLVVLNGCSTRGQVEALLAQGVPVVVATSADVNDKKATQFALRFYQALADHASIQTAFDLAIGEIMTRDAGLKDEIGRGLSFRKESGPVWGIHYHKEGESVLEKGLPSRPVYPVRTDYIPNELLIEKVWESLQGYSDESWPSAGRLSEKARKRMQIINSLPAPIAEHIRQLIVPSPDTQMSYDRTGLPRLQRIALTYQTLMELLAFILVAQVWEMALLKGSLEVSKRRQEEILNFFKLRQEEQLTYDYVSFIRHVRELIDHNQGEYFIEEISTTKDLLYREGDFQAACFFLEALRVKVFRHGVEEGEIHELCCRAEESLATMLSYMGFLAKYSLVAIRDINVYKYRHDPTAQFHHTAYFLRNVQGGLDSVPLDLRQFMDNHSVVLFNEETEKHLCLSPFIIDVNAFKANTNIPKLYFISHYEVDSEVFCFKPVNQPPQTNGNRFGSVVSSGQIAGISTVGSPFLSVAQREFAVVKDQLDAFVQLITQGS